MVGEASQSGPAGTSGPLGAPGDDMQEEVQVPADANGAPRSIRGAD